MYPLKVSAPLKDYLWGGKRLKTEYGFQSDSEIVAEAWVLSCRDDGESFVLNGELKGKSLRQAISVFGQDCLGKNAEKFPYFPLLIKLIDAKQKLSIQVHPDDEYALAHEGQFGKTEMWYVIDCAPSAKLIYGLQKTVTQEELEQVIREDRITEICHEVPVKKGDVFYIPSGTIHAIGEGILIAEIQQNSNITYRVSDYGRLGADGKPRMLHREKALQVITREPAPALDSEPGVIQAVSGCRERVLADCRYFSVKSLELDGRTERCVKDSFVSLLVLEGVCDFFWNGGNMELQKGDSLFIPAGLPFALDGKGQLLLSQV